MDITPNQLSKFRTKNWIEVNDQSRVAFSVNSQSRYKSTMIKSSLCDYSAAYIIVKGRITITEAGADDAAKQANERDKGVIFKNCVSFINCKSKINNTEINNAKDIDIAMPMYSLIEYSDNYSKACGSLWQYYKDESFKSKIKISRKPPNNCNTKNVEIIVSLKSLSNF